MSEGKNGRELPQQAAAPARPDGGADPKAAEQAGEQHSEVLVLRPAALLRLQSELEALAVEVHHLGEDATDRAVWARVSHVLPAILAQLQSVMAEPEQGEMHTFFDWIAEGGALSEDELRVAVAQLLGWVDGVISGIRVAMILAEPAAAPEGAAVSA